MSSMTTLESTMIPTVRASSSLQTALAHAIIFLTRPLTSMVLSTKLISLQHALSSTLTTHLLASWSPANPSRGSGRRCLTFTPGRTPPRPIFTAAQQAGVDCRTWMTVLGSREFDLFIDPGRVRMRYTGSSTFEVVWSATPVTPEPKTPVVEEDQAPIDVEIRTAFRATMARSTRARLSALLSLRTDLAAFANSSDSDSEDSSDAESEADSLFSASSGSSRSSVTSPCGFSPKTTRRTPCITFTPASPIASSSVPFPTRTFICAPTSSASPVKPTSTPVSPVSSPCKLSRRERARQRRDGVITLPPTAPTAYDGGKTNVLGGGVRLGSAVALAGRA